MGCEDVCGGFPLARPVVLLDMERLPVSRWTNTEEDVLTVKQAAQGTRTGISGRCLACNLLRGSGNGLYYLSVTNVISIPPI